jgi:phage tail-like protein
MPLNDTSKIALANRFHVVMDEGDHDLGSWSKVDGLDVTWDVAEYRAGDIGNHRWFYPGNTKYSSIRLTRAACPDSMKVKQWLSQTSFNHKPHGGKLELCDASGAPVAHWELKQVLPVKWSIVSFDATASQVAVETLELHHLGFLDDEVS